MGQNKQSQDGFPRRACYLGAFPYTKDAAVHPKTQGTAFFLSRAPTTTSGGAEPK